MNEWLELVGMNRVSTPESERFICAIWSSDSKSETALSPLTIAVAPTSLATSTSSVETETIRTVGRCVIDAAIMSRRSSRSKSDEDFCGLRSAATTTSSKRRVARSTTSR